MDYEGPEMEDHWFLQNGVILKMATPRIQPHYYSSPWLWSALTLSLLLSSGAGVLLFLHLMPGLAYAILLPSLLCGLICLLQRWRRELGRPLAFFAISVIGLNAFQGSFDAFMAMHAPLWIGYGFSGVFVMAIVTIFMAQDCKNLLARIKDYWHDQHYKHFGRTLIYVGIAVAALGAALSFQALPLGSVNYFFLPALAFGVVIALGLSFIYRADDRYKKRYTRMGRLFRIFGAAAQAATAYFCMITAIGGFTGALLGACVFLGSYLAYTHQDGRNSLNVGKLSGLRKDLLLHLTERKKADPKAAIDDPQATLDALITLMGRLIELERSFRNELLKVGVANTEKWTNQWQEKVPTPEGISNPSVKGVVEAHSTLQASLPIADLFTTRQRLNQLFKAFGFPGGRFPKVVEVDGYLRLKVEDHLRFVVDMGALEDLEKRESSRVQKWLGRGCMGLGILIGIGGAFGTSVSAFDGIRSILGVTSVPFHLYVVIGITIPFALAYMGCYLLQDTRNMFRGLKELGYWLGEPLRKDGSNSWWVGFKTVTEWRNWIGLMGAVGTGGLSFFFVHSLLSNIALAVVSGICAAAIYCGQDVRSFRQTVDELKEKYMMSKAAAVHTASSVRSAVTGSSTPVGIFDLPSSMTLDGGFPPPRRRGGALSPGLSYLPSGGMTVRAHTVAVMGRRAPSPLPLAASRGRNPRHGGK